MHSYSRSELYDQRQEGFIKGITFSVIVPLYNTPECFLKDMIDSVRRQTYPGWELCLGDGSDEQHGTVGQICRLYAQKDPRIRYRKLEKNRGIAGNSNACLELARGRFIVLMDHDDILHEAALYEVAKVIRKQNPDVIYTDEAVFESQDVNRIHHFFYKQDYGIDHLRSNNYFCHLTVFRRSLLKKTGGFRSEYDGSQDHDLMLRIISCTDRVVHIPKVLYFWRASESSSANDSQVKKYAYIAGANAVTEHLRVSGIRGYAYADKPGISRIVYGIKGEPLVSIIIIRKGPYHALERCLASIDKKTSYKRYEIISEAHEQAERRKQILSMCPRVRIFDQKPKQCEYVMKNHAAGQAASGDYYLFLDCDAQVIASGWIEEMLMYAQREDVGVVGAMLYYLDDTICHAGYLLGKNGSASSYCYRYNRGENGYYGSMRYAQDLSAVSDACMMVRREVWDRIGGFGKGYVNSMGDVDLCMRMRENDLLVVWTPWAELYCGNAPRGGRCKFRKKTDIRDRDVALFRNRWKTQIKSGDPYYNPNLSLAMGDYTLAWESVFKG